MTMRFWAYRHVNGHIKVKRYSEEFGRDSMDDALDSDFVDDVIGPYEADSRVQAEVIARERLGVSKEVGEHG